MFTNSKIGGGSLLNNKALKNVLKNALITMKEGVINV